MDILGCGMDYFIMMFLEERQKFICFVLVEKF